MNRTPVSSSNIISVGYDNQAAILEVEFISGDIYHYFNVPQSIYIQLVSALSPGQFLSEYIKYNYRYQKI